MSNNIYNNTSTPIQGDESPLKNYMINEKGIHDKILDIYGIVNTTLVDRYLNKYIKISVKRTTRDDLVLMIPVRESKIIFNGCGEKQEDRYGNIYIESLCYNNTKFEYNKNDLFYSEQLVHNYFEIYDIFTFIHIDGTKISIKKSDINKYGCVIIESFGLPYIEAGKMLRGKLLLYFDFNK